VLSFIYHGWDGLQHMAEDPLSPIW